MATKKQILAGRKAVDHYRADHPQLYVHGYHKGIHDAHTPLLETMLAGLKKQGFNSIQEFFAASNEFNVKELGFVSMEDFSSRATKTDEELLGLKWQ